jgi:hypothetical protein
MVMLLNGLLIIPFTAPILVPSLCIATPPGSFGCKSSMETSWPGTWLLVAFIVFITVGIFGALGWSQVYSRRASSGASDGNSGLLWLHLILFEAGVLGATALMAAVGYVGGNVVAQGGSPIVSAEAVRTMIIPPLSNDPNSIVFDMPPVLTAVFIGLALLSQLVGYVALFTLKKPKAS